MTNQEFIAAIAPLCVKYAKKYGFKVASPAIAQACLESGYGTSTKAQHHNYFGLKYRANRLTVNNGTFVDGSSEQNPDGSYVPITDQWYNFDNMGKGVEGYYQFINIPNYAKVKEAGDPLTYLQEIKNAHYATSLNYVQNVYNVITKWNLTKYDTLSTNNNGKDEVKMSNSSLVDCTVLSPNHSGKRTHAIDRITPHCVVGQLTAEAIGGCFPQGRQASCNYGIGRDGRVCLIVDEANRSWCSSSSANDQRAITIECASDKTAPYAFNDAVYNKLVALCADICKRNGKNVLLWIEDKNTSLNYNPKSNEMVLTVHRWFANKSCPGDWMYARMGDLASKVTAILGGAAAPVQPPVQPNPPQPADNKNFPATPFTVDVLVDGLNIRTSPNGNKSGKVTGKGKFTIVKISNGWGLLKSYTAKQDGWIYLENASYVKIGATVAGSATPPAAPQPASKFPYVVQVTTGALNYRQGPGTNYKVNGTIRDRGRYTIIDEQNGWGKLKSGAGWLSLAYTKKI
jgi:hypothetical protein